MRKAIGGVNEAGLSTFAEILTSDEFADGSFRAPIWETSSSPPTFAFDVPRESAARNPLNVPRNGTTWDLVHLGPHFTGEHHRTETLDYDLLVKGSVVLHMQAGDFEMEPGDLAVIQGLLHRWTAGSNGCVLSVVSIDLLGDSSETPSS